MPDEPILGAVAGRLGPPSTMPERARRKVIARHLDRMQRSVAPVPHRDASARQAAAYAYRRLRAAGDALDRAHRNAGVPTAPKVGENLRAQHAVALRDPDAALAWIDAEITYLQALDVKVRADIAVDLVHVPRPGYPAADHDHLGEIAARIERLRAARAKIEAERDARAREALATLRELRPGD